MIWKHLKYIKTSAFKILTCSLFTTILNHLKGKWKRFFNPRLNCMCVHESDICDINSQYSVSLFSLPTRKTRYPLYRKLSGPQGRSGQVRKISLPTGIRSPDRLACSQSLYRLRCPGPLFVLHVPKIMLLILSHKNIACGENDKALISPDYCNF